MVFFLSTLFFMIKISEKSCMEREKEEMKMKRKMKRAVSMLLAVCLMFSLFSVDVLWQTEEVWAAENGTLQNGELTANADGWELTAEFTDTANSGYGFDDGYLSIWTGEAETGSFTMSQTITNITAGNYTASLAAVGNGNKGDSTSLDNLTLTVKDNTSEEMKTVQIITDGWDNWENVVSTEEMSIAEGGSVTITISGTFEGKEWYGIKNVIFDKNTTVEAPITVQKISGLSEDFIHGVDVSSYLSLVQSGVKYYDEEGTEKNLFEILENAGVNYVRLRVWNCPYVVDENGNYMYADADGNEYTADQVDEANRVQNADGYYEYFLKDSGTQVYREGYGGGNCDVETAAIIGKLATDHNMKVLIDFHYSDFWADPKKKSVPKAWDGMTLDEKKTALSEFTSTSLTALKDAGVNVGMVQIGNEINNGMAGETDSANVCELLVEGSKAVRGVDENILIAVHFTDPQQEGYQLGRAGELEEAGVDYDVFATSYYPFWHGTPDQLTADLSEIAETYNKKVMVAEVSYAWTTEEGDGYPNIVSGSAGDQEYGYPISIEGQATAIRDTIAAVAAVGENGIGTFYWEPAWVPVGVYDSEADNAEAVLASNMELWRKYGSGWGSIYAGPDYDNYDPEIKDDKNGGTWDNQAFFDFNGRAISSLNVYKWVYTGAEGPTQVSTVAGVSCEMNYGTEPSLPQTVAVKLNDGTILDVSVVWDAAQAAALKTADFGDYTVEGSVNEFSYETRGETVVVPAGTWTTTCAVKVTGENYVTNGSFEDNEGDGSGWTMTNYVEGGSPRVDKGSSNAKTGLYYYQGWDSSKIDFALDQTITETIPAGYYTLFAYYQGTGVAEVSQDSGLYALVTFKDGTTKEYRANVQINNVWKDFYQAKINGIVLNKEAASIKVGTRIAVTAESAEIGAWVVVDDISLMKSAELPSYTVTFKDGTSVLSAQTVKLGETAAAPAAPTKAGYIFDGWDKAFANITSDIIVNAKWKEAAAVPETRTYTVTFKDGNKVLATQTVESGKAAAAPAAAKTGYTLSWDKAFSNVTANMTVNAKWTANKYKITYNVNGGKSLTTKTKTVTYGKTYGTLAAPKRAGYTFAGWYTAKTKGTKITAKSTVKITKNTTLYARWTKVKKPAQVKKPTVKNSAKKTMKVTFKKVSGAAGYEINYSTSKKFTKKTTKTVSVAKLTRTIGKLTKGKTYYVRVRAYKKDSTGKKVCGKYSSVVKVKISK